MDAFAVAICKGLSMQEFTLKKSATVGMYFGIFQAGMPFLGYLLGANFQDKISSVDHWIVCILLTAVGINMIWESIQQEEKVNSALDFRTMSVLALATSIDALAVGITFAFLQVQVLSAVVFIGVVTLIISMVGVKIGNVFGTKHKSKAELAGGVILIGLGIKILLEHMGILG